jgi:Transcription factor WhiB
MAVSHAPAPADSESAAHTPGSDLMQLALLGPFTDQISWARVARHARCADGDLDPDQWFPVSTDADSARQEAAAAIAICTSCLVRGQCLALSLRHWEIGQHGVWGGLVAAERTALRPRSAYKARGRPDHHASHRTSPRSSSASLSARSA